MEHLDSALYQKLLEEYCRQTMFLSSTHQMTRVPAFAELIAFKDQLLTPLLQTLKTTPGMHIQILLATVAQQWPGYEQSAKPVGDDSGFVAINVRQSADLWLQWGEINGLVP